MSGGKSRLKRYHRDVFFPKWGENSLEDYVEQISNQGALRFSFHALEKITGYSFDYGKYLLKFISQVLREKPLDISKAFEFRAIGEKIKKAVFRFSFEEFPVDLVFVISSDGVIITVFVINKDDFHSTIDPDLYEKGV